ncbi:beta strand repeat-containing protein [Janthinobacterium fluminis]|uniref:YDG domain-containing protein n=1 Tax=Janthinobacterium fluminis TaxID=2987524 RepID=A0ABT5K285_9BURK|nr:YDG domain-containing protein [Janthinobacterium fluminis]MDC8759099.1 YDG domain-containing protein [Janthinobacterium fluminis]
MNAQFAHAVRPTVRPRPRRRYLALLIACCFAPAAANPTLPQVLNGQATFSQQGKVFSITNTPNTIINWQSFSIQPGELTRFIQQSAASGVLNRIIGQDPSQILGALQSNGRVFLINPNGVLFGRDARVDVNGLVASSLALSNADFLAGRGLFTAGATAGAVANQGVIATPAGGQVVLIAPDVGNSGIITAPNGQVVLAAGRSVQLADAANPALQVVVSAPADQAVNLGQVLAQGGRIGIYGALVTQRGSLNADSAALGEGGAIVLRASGTTLLEAGSRTSATGTGRGGRIELLGRRVGLSGDASADASGQQGGGTILVGGDYRGANAALPNAEQTYLGAQTTLKADAGARGDGGKVIVWSDGATRVFGAISARGGVQGGDGGFVETSGHYLDMQARVDTTAARGRTGQLLLDPSNIYIALDSSAAVGAGMMPSGAGTPGDSGGVFADTGAASDSLLTTGRLETALANSNVTVMSSNPNASGGGFIKVVSPLTWSGNRSLTLDASGGIALQAAITAADGSLNLLSAAGDIKQDANGVLQLTRLSAKANAGSILFGNTGNQISGAVALAAAQTVTIAAAALNIVESTSGGALSAYAAAGPLSVGGAINAGGAAVALQAAGGDVSIGAPLALGGDLTLSASGAISAPLAVNVGGTFRLNGGNWVQNGASLPAFAARDFQLNGGSFVRAMGGDGSTGLPFRIADVYGLQGVGRALYQSFVLAGDIDAKPSAGWNGGAGFAPIGGIDTNGYVGHFDGAGHAIVGLSVNRPGSVNVGLFGTLNGAFVKDLSLLGGFVAGAGNVGALAGRLQEGTVQNVSASAAVNGGNAVGGLVGQNDGAINRARASGGVVGWDVADGGGIGGLVGRNGSFGSISEAFASGVVTGARQMVGGLVGNNEGNIGIVAAGGAVSGARSVGGLVGRNAGSIHDAAAFGAVAGGSSSSSSSGAGQAGALAAENLGGLVGENVYPGSVANVYSSGAVAGVGFAAVGGLIGFSNGTLSHGYWNSEASGQTADGAGATGLSAAQMLRQDSFAGFDFVGTPMWRIYEGHTTPLLKALLQPLQVNVSGAAKDKVYDGQRSFFNGSLSYVGLRGGDTAPDGVFDYTAAARNVGTYALGGLWSTKYDINYVGASDLTILPRALTVSVGGSKVYDGQLGLGAARFSVNNLVGGDAIVATGKAAFLDKNAGPGKPVHATGVVLSGAGLENYRFSGDSADGFGDISRATLSIAGLGAANRVYDGTTRASVSGALAGVLGDDGVSLVLGPASFVDRHVGNGKTVTIAGAALSGPDAGNYALVGGLAATADITPKPLSTWIGGAGLWSDAANWDGGVVPDGANVLAVNLAGAGLVDYNGAAGATTLRKLAGRQGLSVSGGSLTLGTAADEQSLLEGAAGLSVSGGSLVLGGGLTLDNYAQSGGSVGGAGSLTVRRSFSQSAGSVGIGGALAIVQASGDLDFARLGAATVSLAAEGGRISQSGALEGGSVSARAQNGIALNHAGNRIGSFSAVNSAGGGIALSNSSAPGTLKLGPLASEGGDIVVDNSGGIETGAIQAKGGNVALTAHSPILVQGAIGGGDIALTASSDVVFGAAASLAALRDISVNAGGGIALDGAASLSAGRDIGMAAGGGVSLGGSSSLTVPAGGSIRVAARNGSIAASSGVRINSGGPVILSAPNGAVSAPPGVFSGGMPLIDSGQNPIAQQSAPVAQALNTTVNIINSVTQSASAAVLPVAPAGGKEAAGKAGDKDEAAKKSEDKKDGVASKDTGAKKDEPVKKMYCN